MKPGDDDHDDPAPGMQVLPGMAVKKQSQVVVGVAPTGVASGREIQEIHPREQGKQPTDEKRSV